MATDAHGTGRLAPARDQRVRGRMPPPTSRVSAGEGGGAMRKRYAVRIAGRRFHVSKRHRIDGFPNLEAVTNAPARPGQPDTLFLASMERHVAAVQYPALCLQAPPERARPRLSWRVSFRNQHSRRLVGGIRWTIEQLLGRWGLRIADETADRITSSLLIEHAIAGRMQRSRVRTIRSVGRAPASRAPAAPDVSREVASLPRGFCFRRWLVWGAVWGVEAAGGGGWRARRGDHARWR
jgi:hypothetical protein